MEKTFCSKILQSGNHCKNTAKYGDYCTIHIDNYEAFPLLELPGDILNNIVKCINDPNELKNFASVSPRIQFYVSCNLQKMIKEELPLGDLFPLDDPYLSDKYYCENLRMSLNEDYIKNRKIHLKKSDLLRNKWNYILFLAIGGLYIEFKPAKNKFYVNDFIITISLSENWTLSKKSRLNSPVVVKVVFKIEVEKNTPTSSYKSKFETTNVDEMEHFFRKTIIVPSLV